MNPTVFIEAFSELAAKAHATAVASGFWEDPVGNDAVAIALMHSELSEALDALRHGDPPDDHIPEFSGMEAEFADVIIRIMDTADARGYRVAEAIVAKMEYNSRRPYKHGGKRL